MLIIPNPNMSNSKDSFLPIAFYHRGQITFKAKLHIAAWLSLFYNPRLKSSAFSGQNFSLIF